MYVALIFSTAQSPVVAVARSASSALAHGGVTISGDGITDPHKMLMRRERRKQASSLDVHEDDQPDDALNKAASEIFQSHALDGYIQQMKDWGKTLPGLSDFKGTVFYPFGGGDVLSVLGLFPNAHTFVFAALMDVGNCHPETWPRSGTRSLAVAKVLNGYAHGHITSRGHLQTGLMDKYFDNDTIVPTVGITPLMMASLSTMDQEIISMKCGPSAIGDALTIKFRSNTHTQNGVNGASKSNGSIRKVIYVKVDLLKPPPSLEKFLHANGDRITMIKAASYLIRRRLFTSPDRESPLIKAMLNSVAILQDDTGFRFDCVSHWNTTLYGSYHGPAKNKDEPVDMAADYDDSLHAATCSSSRTMQPLPMPFGYDLRYKLPHCPSSASSSCSGKSKQPIGVPEVLTDFPTIQTNGIAVLAWRV